MHRLSYWKTTAVALVAASLHVPVLVWLNHAASDEALLVVSKGLIGLLLIVFVLIAAGGLVCLWRDAREATGEADIFALLSTKAPEVGLLSRFGLRFLMGPALRPGDVVRVRSRIEIESTLDAAGTLDGLPFMAEMVVYFGRTFRVHRRIDKINDMRNKTGLRRMRGTVTLTDVRCSGSNHDGCQAQCQILWKDSWLRRLPNREVVPPAPRLTINVEHLVACSGSSRKYVCQMTNLWEASSAMSPLDIRQDFRPLFLGNFGIRAYLIAIVTQVFNLVQRLRGGVGYPFMPPAEVAGVAPVSNLNLGANEVVTVRPKNEIAQTLSGGRNKGLWFDREMTRYCNQSATVRMRVERIIHEATGKMVVMKTPCIMLDKIVATGEFLRLCSQCEYIFWREIWLTRPAQSSPDESG